MTDLDRLTEVLKKNSVEFDTIHVKEDENNEDYDAYTDKTTLWISDENELFALCLTECSADKATGIFDEILNKNIGRRQIFPRLKHLYISSCSLHQLPDSLQQLSHIEYFDVNFNDLQVLPDWLQDFTNLRSLSLTGNNNLSDCLPELIALDELDIGYMRKPLPDWVQKFSSLKRLNIDGNGIQFLPDWLRDFKCLEELSIYNNNLESLPDWIKYFANMEALYLGKNKLQTLPNGLQKLTNLKILNLEDNNIQILPDWLQNLECLESLDIGKNDLQSLPEWMQKLTGLRRLGINDLNLQALPDWLQKLTKLNWLSIKKNSLQYLPGWLQKLTNLTCLITDNNNIQLLPDWLQNLDNLGQLVLESNELQFLPEWLHKFTKMNYLRIGRNPLKTIPAALLDMLQRIKIPTDDLSIADVPDEIIEQGWEAIRQYYAEQESEALSDEKDDVEYTATELKVMIIGAGSSGKSSISKAMNHDEYDPNEASTVGIALKNIPCKFREQDWTLRVWDFGGQEAYAATQTLFMTKKSLYLVVADGRTENRPDPYLSYVDTFAPESPVILIINKVDENERADLNRQVYLKEHSNLHPNMIRFSCVNDSVKCVEELLEEIENVLFSSKYGPLLQAQWTPRWRTVRNDLIELLEKTKTYIDADDYYAICKDNRLPKTAWDIVRNACHILGIIFSYRNTNANPPIDRILHPEWVTKGINSLCKIPENGLYPAKDIYPHMRNHGYDNNETLSIMSILQAEDLAIMLPNHNIFIPALLPGKPPPDFPEDFGDWYIDEDGKTNSSEIRFRYPFLHPVVKQKFFVRLLSSGISIQAFRYGACWHNNDVRVVMLEETDDLAFYLQSDNDSALHGEQRLIQTLMERLHNDIDIKSTMMHVFRTVDDGGESRHSAEYSNEDLWTLKDVMKVDELPLPGINRILSVSNILAGYAKNPHRERTYEMGGNTNIIYGNQTIVHNSPGAVATGGDANNSSITTSVGPTPEQTLFAEETIKAINIIKTLRGLDRSHRDALIAFLNEANDATQSDDEVKKKSCKEKFAAFIVGAGKKINKALKVLTDLVPLATFFNLDMTK